MNRKPLAVIALAIGLVPLAQAQSDLIPTNLNVRLGFVYPTERATRNYTGQMGGIGVDFNTTISLWKGAQGFFSIDFMTGAVSGDKGYFLPIMYNARIMLGQTPTGTSTYFFVGAGAVNMDVGVSKTVFGARGGIGANLSETTFLEATYMWSDDNGYVRASNLGIYYGFRF